MLENFIIQPLPKIFIVGLPRTGTSVLYMGVKKTLGYPDPVIESHVMPAFGRMLEGFDLYRNFFPPKERPGVVFDRLYRHEVVQYLARLARAFYGLEFGEGWIDKTPSPDAVMHIEFTATVFPGAKIIATKRTGIEVVASYMRKFPGFPFENACRSWTMTMKELQRVAVALLPKKHLLVVDQFDFHNKPFEVSYEIAHFLNRRHIAYDLGVFLKNERIEKSSRHDWTQRLTLDTIDWNDAQKTTFKSLCGETMEMMGYRT